MNERFELESREKADLSWRGGFQEFADHVSVSGVRYIFGKNSSIVGRIIWALLLLLWLLFIVYMIYNRAAYYTSYPISTSVELRHKKSIKFPLVTICSENCVSRSAFDRYSSKSKWSEDEEKSMLKVFRLIYGNDALIEDLFDAVESLSQKDSSVFDKTTKDHQKYIDMLRSVGHNWHMSVRGCQFQSRMCEPNYFLIRLTNGGSCLTFQPTSDARDLKSAGQKSGLRLMLYVGQREYLVSKSLTAGFRVFVHGDNDVPDMDNFAFHISPGSQTVVSLKEKQMEELGPPFGNCGDKGLRYLQGGNYTTSKCMLDQLIQATISKCECVPAYMAAEKDVCDVRPGEKCDARNASMPICGAKATHGCVQSQTPTYGCPPLCDCPQACKGILYDTSVSSTKLSTMLASHLQNSFSNFLSRHRAVRLNTPGFVEDITWNRSILEFLDSEISVLNVYYPKLSVEISRSFPAFTWAQFLSEVGAALALMFGSTILTILDFIYFPFAHAWKRCR